MVCWNGPRTRASSLSKGQAVLKLLAAHSSSPVQELVATYGSDAVRFYFMKEIAFG